jgi:hypothetical protein
MISTLPVHISQLPLELTHPSLPSHDSVFEDPPAKDGTNGSGVAASTLILLGRENPFLSEHIFSDLFTLHKSSTMVWEYLEQTGVAALSAHTRRATVLSSLLK